MTEFGLSQLELENKKSAKNVFYTLKKIGTIEKILSALFLIRNMYLTGKQRLCFPVRYIFLIKKRALKIFSMVPIFFKV